MTIVAERHPLAFQGQSIRSISEKEFSLLRGLICREAGIYLSEHKVPLLVGRLTKRLRKLGLSSFQEYYDLLVNPGNDRELECMLDCICTNETRFFREPGHWEFLSRTVYPQWQSAAERGLRPKHIRAWSAACSTGEEPYSLAMSLLDRFPGWEIEILATDLSTRVLAQAHKGIWRLEKSCEIPTGFLKAFMLKGIGEFSGLMKAGPSLRSLVDFRRVNLNQETYPVQGCFDLIFCRNVLIYFNTQTKQNVLERLLRHLSADGYLFLGYSESINILQERARSVGPAILGHAPASARACIRTPAVISNF